MPEAASLRQQMARELNADTFPTEGYTDPHVLSSLLKAGYSVNQLHDAFDVSQRTIYTWIDRHDLDTPRPPTRGPATTLWKVDPDTVNSS